VNLNLYDAEQHLLRQKELARAAAESYQHARYLESPGGLRRAYRRALVATGDRMITLGYRLRGEIDTLSAAPDLAEPLSLRANGTGY
jgi:hypothetical protein